MVDERDFDRQFSTRNATVRSIKMALVAPEVHREDIQGYSVASRFFGGRSSSIMLSSYFTGPLMQKDSNN